MTNIIFIVMVILLVLLDIATTYRINVLKARLNRVEAILKGEIKIMHISTDNTNDTNNTTNGDK